VVELLAKDTAELGKRELSRAVACRDALQPPLVLEAGHHIGHLDVRCADEMESPEHGIYIRVELGRRLEHFFNAGM